MRNELIYAVRKERQQGTEATADIWRETSAQACCASRGEEQGGEAVRCCMREQDARVSSVMTHENVPGVMRCTCTHVHSMRAASSLQAHMFHFMTRTASAARCI